MSQRLQDASAWKELQNYGLQSKQVAHEVSKQSYRITVTVNGKLYADGAHAYLPPGSKTVTNSYN